MGKLASVNLTKSLVESLEARDQNYYVSDFRVRGLCLQVARGGTKSFVLRYRVLGASRTWTLGRFPNLSVDQARKEAEEALGRIRKGADPSQERRIRKALPTVAELCDQFLAEYCPIHLRPKTAVGYGEMIEGAIRPGLGRIKVDALTHAQVARWHHDLRDTPRKANYALAVLRKMLNLAFTWGYRSGTNPCLGVKKYPERARTRVPEMDELGRLWEAFGKAGREQWGTPHALACLKVILLTGSRKTAIRILRWEHVDIEGGFIRLPAGSEGAKGAESIALPPEAVEILKALPRLLGSSSQWVFPSTKPGVPVTNIDRLWYRIREDAGSPDLRIHDLRHLWGTTAGALNFQGPMIQAALNHKTPAMTARYVNLKDAAKLEVARAVAEVLAPKTRDASGA